MAVKSLSIADLQRELVRRQVALSGLQSKHKSLLGRIKDVEAEIASIVGSGAGTKRGPGRPRKTAAAKNSAGTGRRGRGKNAMTLSDSIANAMEVGAVSSPKEVALFVRSNGYTTKSKTFGIQVATTLAKDNRFKRVGRGQYQRIK